MKQPDQFNRIFKPGAFWALLGLPRTGKTTTLMLIAEAALMHGWIVFANTKLIRWDPVKKRMVRAEIPNYHFVRYWSELFALLPRYVGMIYDEETGIYRERYKILFCVDEAMATGFTGGKTLASGDTRSVVEMAAQSAKLGITICVVAHTEKMLTSQMRVGGLLTGYIRKIGSPPYDAIETGRFEVPNPDIVNFDPENRSHYRMYPLKVEPEGIARSPEMIALPSGGYDPEQVIFSSKSPASLKLGTYPDTNIAFNLDHVLEVLSDPSIDEADLPEVIAYEMQHPSKPGSKPKKRGDDAEEEVEELVSEFRGEEKTGEVKTRIISLLKSGIEAAEVIRRVGKERRSQVYEYQKQIRAGLI